MGGPSVCGSVVHPGPPGTRRLALPSTRRSDRRHEHTRAACALRRARSGNHAPFGLAERRRSRTYQPWGYHGLPVLKTGQVWLWERDYGW